MAKQGKPPPAPQRAIPATPIPAGSTPANAIPIESKLNASPKSIPIPPRFTPGALLGGAYRYRRYILGGAVVVYGAGRFISNRLEKARRDFIDPNGTVIYWNVFDGGIVEEKDPSSLLTSLIGSRNATEEPANVMTLHETIKTIRTMQNDDRIRGIIADFSTITSPSAPSYTLGLAQLEEIQSALRELRAAKTKKFGSNWRSVAFTDSFSSQAQYLFATCFDEVYTQRTGSVPLVGLSTSVPFFGRLLKYVGIEVVAEARTEYKSFVAPYTSEALTKAQKDNQIQLLGDLNDTMLSYIARNRFSKSHPGQSGLEHVKKLSQNGPYTASEAVKLGLLTGTIYTSGVYESFFPGDYPPFQIPGLAIGDMPSPPAPVVVETVIPPPTPASTPPPPPSTPTDTTTDSTAPTKSPPRKQNAPIIDLPFLSISYGNDILLSPSQPVPPRDLRQKSRMKGFYQYSQITARAEEREARRVEQDACVVGVVYLLGTIDSSPGEFGTAAVVKGLKEAALDDKVRSVVLRLDTGGGGVIESDTIWAAVRDFKKSGKVIAASFGNASASGGYLVSTDMDSIFASPSTITGSIGVAALRPTFTQSFFDRLHVTFDSYYTGSKTQSVIHTLTAAERERNARQVDEMYDDFKERVVNGRGISKEVIESVAGGRVYSGLRAFGMIASMKGLSSNNKEKVAVISPDQETSSFAPPEAAIDESLVVIKPAGSPTTEKEEEYVSTVYNLPTGDYGRGIVDRIGGLEQAMLWAATAGTMKGIAAIRKLAPGNISQAEAARIALPRTEIVVGEYGNPTFALPQVVLKRFPEKKSWFARLSGRARGDPGFDSESMGTMMKVAAARWIFSVAASLVVEEMQELGILDFQSRMGLNGRNRMRAELGWKIE